MLAYMNYGPYICIGVVLAVLFVLWAFYGGKNYDFVGLAPLNPNTYNSYTGSVYQWGVSENMENNPEEQNEIENPYEEYVEQITYVDDHQQSPQVTFISNVDQEEQLPIEVVDLNEPPPISSISNYEFGVPTEKKGRRISKGERICCQTMERIYGVKFKSIWPDWLRNPETNRKLELDCYNEELQIAVEYNGEQHYHWPNFTPQSEQEFINQVRRDQLKAELCRQYGVYLIVVPYTVPHNKIPEYITSHLPETIQQRLIEERTLENIY